MSHHARKRFGQHFLTAPEIVGDIISAIAPQPGDTIVEIGPGRAALTDPLSKFDIDLHAIEFDRNLCVELSSRYADCDSVTIHEADALAFDYSSIGDNLRVVGNLPYNISTPLLFSLLEHRAAISDFHFMLQKEVVDRMVASPGSKRFGRLTVMLGGYLEMLPLFNVPPEAFSPPPKVQSAIVRMRPLPEGSYNIVDAAVLSEIVGTAFSKRRKTLRNALKGVTDDEMLASAGIDPSLRPEQIPVNNWITLSNLMAKNANGGKFDTDVS